MPAATRSDRPATRGNQAVHRWSAPDPDHVVLLAHGIGEHARRYDHVAGPLVADGAVVVAPDHYGHGHSDGERAVVDDIEVMVTDLAAIARDVRAEFPGLPVVLVGHSMGGLIATRFAQRDEVPLAGLALSGAFTGGNPAFAPLLDADPFPEVPIDPSLLSRDERVGQAYVADPLVTSTPLPQASFRGLFAGVGAVASGPRIGELPVLWMHGADDQLVPAEVNRAAFAAVEPTGVEEHVYPGARHEIFNETNQDEVIAHLTAFVRRVVGRA